LEDAAGTANLLCPLFEICKTPSASSRRSGNDPEFASYLRIEERELEVVN